MERYYDLGKATDHIVGVEYCRLRGRNKEGSDSIDIFGWLGYPTQIELNFLCRDSILVAPLVLHPALFSDLARAWMREFQEWLSSDFKATSKHLQPGRDLSGHLLKLDTLYTSLPKKNSSIIWDSLLTASIRKTNGGPDR